MAARSTASCCRAGALLLLVSVSLVALPGCGPSAAKYVGTWMTDAQPARSGATMQAGYVLEAGGKGRNITIQDYSQADAATRARVQPALDRRVADGRLKAEAPGRYVSESPCTWTVQGDHIVLDTGLKMGDMTICARLSADGKELMPGVQKDGKITWTNKGLHKQ